MFNFREYMELFQEYKSHGEIYNDAIDYGVVIEMPDAPVWWRVLGIHHLTPEENRGNHNVFVEMLCKQGEREGFRAINWTWEGRKPDEIANPVFAGQKGPDELIDLPLHSGMKISVWTHGGEIAKGFHSSHPDEGEGNTYGHHSFFVCFQEIGEDDEVILPPPVDEKEVVMLISKKWLDQLEVNNEGYIVVKG